MADSIFTRIIKGEIPCHKVYEDELTFAFMDNHPIQPGMVLVVSKTPAETAWDLSDADYQALMNTVKKVALKMRQVFPQKKRVSVMIEGLDVPHVHVKVFPINSGEEFRAVPDTASEPDHDEELAAMAKKLALK